MEGRAKLIAQGIALAAVAAMLALLVWKVASDQDGGVAEQLAQGKNPMAPVFLLQRLDREGAVSLASLRGKGIVVNFWASWCIPCKDEAPFLQQAYERHRSQGLVVLGIDAQDFRQDARKFMRRYGITYPVAHDGKGSTLGKWGVNGFPETFFVNREGKLVGERISGGVDIERNREAFNRGVQLALAGP